jgi:serine/threonine protein kinase
LKADIYRRCNPYFNLQSVVTKREKLKEITSDLEDFFRKLFVVDAKKRITFANIIHHPLFFDYVKEFEQSVMFYKELENNEKYMKDDIDNGNNSDMDNEM